MFKINYLTGIEEKGFATVEAAKAAVNPAYTQKDILIEDEDGVEFARLVWWGVPFDAEESEEEDLYISFGNYGYYQNWSSL